MLRFTARPATADVITASESRVNALQAKSESDNSDWGNAVGLCAGLLLNVSCRKGRCSEGNIKASSQLRDMSSYGIVDSAESGTRGNKSVTGHWFDMANCKPRG